VRGACPSRRRVEQLRLDQGALYRIDFSLDVSNPRELNGERRSILFDLTECLCHFEEFIALNACSLTSESSNRRLNGDNALVQTGTFVCAGSAAAFDNRHSSRRLILRPRRPPSSACRVQS
jgi:hypothetical protein